MLTVVEYAGFRKHENGLIKTFEGQDMNLYYLKLSYLLTDA